MNQNRQFKVLGQRLIALGYLNYGAYLQSKHWRNLRAKYFIRYPGKPCVGCWRGDIPLQLHHRTYIRLGNERFSDLVPLCDSCHGKTHDLCRIDTKADFHIAHRTARTYQPKDGLGFLGRLDHSSRRKAERLEPDHNKGRGGRITYAPDRQ